MNRTAWTSIRLVGAVLILALVVLKVGGGPFLDGVRAVRPAALLAVVALTALTTLAAAWRWQAVSRCLGDPAPLGAAVADYYRSQFLNSVLPGGVLGDVNRGLTRGRALGDLRASLRSVAWDRVLGQGVQVLVTAAVLLGAGWSAHAGVVVLPAAGLVLAGLALLVLRRRRSGGDRLGPALPRVLLASLGATAGHSAIFLVAARAAGVRATPQVLLPLGLLLLVAMAVPLSVGGWGIREGAAAWLFAAAGLGPEVGVTVAAAYGTMTLVAVLPGAGLLLLDRVRAARRKEAR